MFHLDLFSGIGGFALAAHRAGIQTLGFCEIDESCHKVLSRHWPNVPIHHNIKELNGYDYAGIDIITGGYPCQPFSVAGSQKAEKDPRHLWPYMRGIIAQARPSWVICENVYGHVKLGLDNVLYDLEGIGYACQPFVIPALAVGANHNRRRVFIVAHTTSNGLYGGKIPRGYAKAIQWPKEGPGEGGNPERCSYLRSLVDRGSEKTGIGGTKPPALRVDAGLPNRMDRNKMIGNSIHPAIAYQLFRTILAQQPTS